MKRLKKELYFLLRDISYYIGDLLHIIATFSILIGILFYTLKIYSVNGTSMYPTLKDKDTVIASIFVESIYSFKRGDIITFKHCVEENDPLVKRVIGIPGDKITIQEGNVYINDKLLTESYLSKGTYTKGSGTLVVPKDHVFVMGDNRAKSLDSRSFGPISIKSITRKVLFIKLY